MYKTWCSDSFIESELSETRFQQFFMTLVSDVGRFYNPYEIKPEDDRWVQSQCVSASEYGGPWLKEGPANKKLPTCVHPQCNKDGDGESKKYRYEVDEFGAPLRDGAD